MISTLDPGAALRPAVRGRQNLIARFIADERGATAIEYGLIVALIAVVIVGAVTTLGGKLNGAFKTVASKIP